jgi:release factor glutamine methyltransferase
VSGPPSPGLEARIAFRLRAAGSVFAEEEAALLVGEYARDAAALERAVQRRAAGEPLEVIVGWAEFCGLRLAVAPGVFVPRPRSAFLVEHAVALVRPGDVLLDLCCGVGAIAAAVSARMPGLQVHAAELDPVAAECAARNLPHGRVVVGDLFDPLPESLAGRIDLLVANAPYVPTDQIELMPREARLHERPAALDGGADGLDLHRRIAAAAPHWVAPGGHLLIETSERQASRTRRIMLDAGLDARIERDDEADATIVIGTLPASVLAATTVAEEQARAAQPDHEHAPGRAEPLDPAR